MPLGTEQGIEGQPPEVVTELRLEQSAFCEWQARYFGTHNDEYYSPDRPGDWPFYSLTVADELEGALVLALKPDHVQLQLYYESDRHAAEARHEIWQPAYQSPELISELAAA